MRAVAFIVCVLLTVALCYVHAARLGSAKYRRLALIAEGRGLHDLVVKAALNGLDLNPFNINLHGYAAHAFVSLKEYKRALIHLEIRLRYYPNDLNALINAAYAYFFTDNLKKAFEMRDRIKRIKPSYIKP